MRLYKPMPEGITQQELDEAAKDGIKIIDGMFCVEESYVEKDGQACLIIGTNTKTGEPEVIPLTISDDGTVELVSRLIARL